MAEEAQELLQTFSVLYLKNYGAAVFQKIKDELEGNQDDELKLKYRPLHVVKRQDLLKGECYVIAGDGPGCFSKWKKQFIVERNDNSIDIFANEQAYEKHKKPVATIRTAGYKVVTNVSDYYAAAMREIAAGIGLTDLELIAYTAFSRYSWALAHPQRKNYIFQLHEGINASCSCFSGNMRIDLDEAGFDRREEIMKYVEAMQKCVARANSACNASTEISRVAFREACQQIPSKIDTLKNWSDNGSEAEVLVDLLMAALLPSVRDDIFKELKGPAYLKIKLWYKAVSVIRTTMVKAVEPAWDQMQKGAQKLDSSVEAAVRPALSKIIAVQAAAEKKIQDIIGDRLSSSSGSYVTPFIKPIFDAFESPLKQGFINGREILSSKLDAQTLSQNKEARNSYLDSLAWSPASTANIRLAAQDVVEPLEILASLSSEVFDDLDPEEHRGNAEEMLLQTLDAAAYTVAVHLDGGSQFDDALLQQVLADYDHDSVIKRCEFVTEVARSILIGSFKKLTSPITEPVVNTINDAIPEQMQDFLNVENILDTFIDHFVGKAIDKGIRLIHGSSSSSCSIADERLQTLVWDESSTERKISQCPVNTAEQRNDSSKNKNPISSSSPDCFHKKSAPLPARPTDRFNVTPESPKVKQNYEKEAPTPVKVPGYRPIPPMPPSHQVAETSLETLQQQQWFFGKLSREAANKKVSDVRRDGAFLVRVSEKGGLDAPYALCVTFGGEVFNIQIHRREDQLFALGSPKADVYCFSSVMELIDYFRNHSIQVMTTGEPVMVQLRVSPAK